MSLDPAKTAPEAVKAAARQRIHTGTGMDPGTLAVL